MTDESLKVIAAHLATLQAEVFLPGQKLVTQGDVSDVAYYLAQGTVSVTVETPYDVVPLATLKSPRILGEIGVLASMPRTASIEAVTPCRVFRIGRTELIRLGKDEPALLLSIIAQLGQQIKAVNETLGLYTNALAALEQHSFDERILADLANPPPALAAFGSTFSRFAKEIQAKRRQRDDLASAALIQKSLLPSTTGIPADCGVRLAAAMRPAREVGGDFYDHFMIDESRLVFVVGDVCGKGLAASLFMAIAVTALRTSSRSSTTTAETIARAADILARDNAASMFSTVFYGILDLRTGDIEYANCGHNPPMIIRADGRENLLASTGLPLGLYAEPVPQIKHSHLGPGETIVVYSDGITEAQSAGSEEFTDERLSRLLQGRAGSEPATVVREIFADVDAFASGADQFDDMTCLVVSR